MSKFCRNCGKEINIETGFCPNCGTEVKEEVSKEQKDNTVLGFVLSLLGFLCCTYLAIPGLIISIMSFQDIKNGIVPTKNKGLAIAGIIIGIIGIITIINNFINPDPDITELVEKFLNV